MLNMSRSYLRGSGSAWGKRFCWNRICVPYLSWRDVETVCRTRNGGRFYVKPNDFVENRLCFFGVWEPAVTRLFEHILKAGDVVVDVGANIGYYSILAEKLVGESGTVFAIEPSESIRQRLKRNLELNASKGIRVVPYGAWHQSDAADLHFIEGNRGSSTLSDADPSEKSERIALRTLDSLIPTELHQRVTLMKIDVEGAEEFALLGAESILRSASNLTVLCEVDPGRMASLKGSAQRLIELMQERGFSVFRIDNDYTVEGYISPAQRITLTPTIDCPTEACDLVFFSSGSKLAHTGDGRIEIAAGRNSV